MKRRGNNSVPSTFIAALLLLPAIFYAQGFPRPDPLPRSFEKQGVFDPVEPGQVLPHLIQPIADPPPGSVFDVISYQLDLKAAMVNEDFGGRTLITLRLLTPRDSIELYQLNLQIDSVRVDGTPVTYVVSDALERFVIRLGVGRQQGDTLRIAVWYRRLPGIPRGTLRLGYNYFSDTTTGIPAALGYTMSEPREARCWMPCYDEPWDKATAAMNIMVPAGYVATSNGILDGVTPNGDSTVTWHWHEGHQITTYLMCATISRFAIPEMKFARAPGDTIPLQYYVWAQDSLETATYLPTVKLMVANLSNVFGPYPWDKYGMSCISPFNYGGMEHQSITTLHEAYRTNELVVVHELAHQWWGDLVTCGSWADIWLNESFATYGEALWRESLGGGDALRSYMSNITQFTLASWSGRIYNPEAQGFGVFPSSVYTKGAWVLHTLRGVIGDSSFFRSLRLWRATYAERSALTADFQAVVESVAGTDLAWFFDEWIYGSGWPVYSTSFEWASDTLFFRIDQQQSSGWPTYKMPLTMGVYGGGILSKFTVVDSLRSQSFVVPWRSVPDSLVVDPDSWVLKQREVPPFEPPTGSGPAQFALLQNYPNPFNPGTDIPFILPRRSAITLEIYDMLGRKIKDLFLAKLEPGGHSVHFNGTGLATGVYLYRLQARPIDGTSPMRAAGKMMLVK